MKRTSVAVCMLSPCAPELDQSPRRTEGLPILIVSPRTPGLDPSLRRAKGLPVIAAPPGAVPAGRKLVAGPFTFGQPSTPSVSLLLWSMRPWQSARARFLWADGFPGSHGPPEKGVNEQNIEFWLTSRRTAALRNLAARGRLGRPRRCSPGQPCRGSGQDRSLARGARRAGSLGRDPGRDDSLSAAKAGVGLGQVVESTRGAPRWRPPAS
jgi:hypothetical protein